MSNLLVSGESAPTVVMAPASSWSGAAVAFSIAFVAGLVGLGFEQPLLLIGIPAATVAGWWLGPKISPTGGVIGIAVAMAVATIAIADTLVVVPLGIGSSMTASAAGAFDPFRGIAAGIFLWLIGFIVVGIPIMAVTVPCGLVWAALVRKLARTAAPRAGAS